MARTELRELSVTRGITDEHLVTCPEPRALIAEVIRGVCREALETAERPRYRTLKVSTYGDPLRRVTNVTAIVLDLVTVYTWAELLEQARERWVADAMRRFDALERRLELSGG